MTVGIVKTHNLGFQECEALQAVFTKDLCPNQIVGPAKLVVSALPLILVYTSGFHFEGVADSKHHLRIYGARFCEQTRVRVW